MRRNYLLEGLLILSLLAMVWPSILPTQPDPFVLSKPYLGLLIGITMFVIGCLLPRGEVDQVLRRWPTVLGGTATQYTAMPLIAYGIAHLFPLDPDIRLGIIMAGCVPGAMASNVLTLMAKGNVSYSVSLTTTATLLSPLVVPGALWLTLGATHHFDLVQVSTLLLLQVVLPVLAGHLLCRRFETLARFMAVIGPSAANVSILWVIAVVVGLNRGLLEHVPLALIYALFAQNVLGYASGSLAGGIMRLPTPMRRALTLEVGMQNAGLGTALVIQMFPEQSRAAIPTAAYTVGCMLTGTLLAQYWSRQTEKSEGSDADGQSPLQT